MFDLSKQQCRLKEVTRYDAYKALDDGQIRHGSLVLGERGLGLINGGPNSLFGYGVWWFEPKIRENNLDLSTVDRTEFLTYDKREFDKMLRAYRSLCSRATYYGHFGVEAGRLNYEGRLGLMWENAFARFQDVRHPGDNHFVMGRIY